MMQCAAWKSWSLSFLWILLWWIPPTYCYLLMRPSTNLYRNGTSWWQWLPTSWTRWPTTPQNLFKDCSANTIKSLRFGLGIWLCIHKTNQISVGCTWKKKSQIYGGGSHSSQNHIPLGTSPTLFIFTHEQDTMAYTHLLPWYRRAHHHPFLWAEGKAW